MKRDTIGYRYLSETIGLPIEILSNDFQEFHGNETHMIVFQLKIEEPDLFAFGILFSLSLMSFTYAHPCGYSEIEFKPDEEWNIDYFLQGLNFNDGNLVFSGDYISGRQMKTTITYEPGGKVKLLTVNRGKGADRWVLNLQGKKHIQGI